MSSSIELKVSPKGEESWEYEGVYADPDVDSLPFEKSCQKAAAAVRAFGESCNIHIGKEGEISMFCEIYPDGSISVHYSNMFDW